MRSYAHIIIEQQNPDHWTAWFADAPQNEAGGPWPSDALARLLLLFGAEEFELDEVSAIDEAMKAGHLEYRIPFRRRRRAPTPSMN